MSIENRALTSCKARLLKAEADYCLSNRNERTKSKKYQQVRLFKFIYEAVQYYINRPRWTHVTEALPTGDDGMVLITDKEGSVYTAYLGSDGVFIVDALTVELGQVDVNVVAWMPMPKPYESKKERE